MHPTNAILVQLHAESYQLQSTSYKNCRWRTLLLYNLNDRHSRMNLGGDMVSLTELHWESITQWLNRCKWLINLNVHIT